MLPKSGTDRVSILGVQVDALDIASAVRLIVTTAARPASAAGYVVKPYVEFLDRAGRDADIRGLLNGAWLSLPDGVACLWAAHYLYAGPRSAVRFCRTLAAIVLRPTDLCWPLPERIAGTNFTLPLLEAAAEAGLRVFLMGLQDDEAIRHTAQTLHAKIPGLTIVGTRSGRDTERPNEPVGKAWIAEAGEHITACRADLILVGMGFPLQERVMEALRKQLAHGVLIGEGGTFEYVSFGGTRPKAPEAIQRVGLEWLWRLAQEPDRLVRQLAVPRFIYSVWKIR